MCARYTIFTEEEIIRMREIIKETERKLARGVYLSHDEIRPSEIAPVITREGPSPVKWGFPAPQGSSLIINARSESYLEKPMFIRAVPCMVPATGFFEWGPEQGQQLTLEERGSNMRKTSRKQKYYFTSAASAFFYMAGLYRIIHSQPSFVILTRDATGSVAAIHTRMPVILEEERAEAWLSEGEMVPLSQDLVCKKV